MTVLHEETYFQGHLTLRVIQEWPNSGLSWEYSSPGGVLGPMSRRSGGCFYRDTDGEKIHGATMEEVVATALRNVRSLFPNLPPPD